MTPLRRALRACTLLLAALLAGAVLTAMAPEPDPAPKRWELDVQMGPLRVATLEAPGRGERVYFYQTFRVTNNTGREIFFAPAFDLATDRGDVVRAGREVPGSVVRTLLDRLENPLLQDQYSVIGPLLQGEENAREGLVVWLAPDIASDEISVFGIGFSGESESYFVPHPETGEMAEVVLRKTLRTTYCLPGELHQRGAQPLIECGRRWIMR